jgi:hypothetical protein
MNTALITRHDGVDDRREHTHAVGAYPVHLLRLLLHAAEKVTSAHDHADFHAQGVYFDDFSGNSSDLVGIQAESARAGQCLS